MSTESKDISITTKEPKEQKIPKEQKFDSIYGDIWIDISTDNYEEMKTLTKNWKNRLNRSNQYAFIDHWLKDHLKKEIQKEKRERFYW